MAQLEVTTGSVGRPGAEGAADAACHADAPSASRGDHPGAVVPNPIRGEPPALWDEAVRRFLGVSRAYLLPGRRAGVPGQFGTSVGARLDALVAPVRRDKPDDGARVVRTGLEDQAIQDVRTVTQD